MVAESLDGADRDSYRWKWAIVSLHSALQGFMVLALRGSNGFHVLSKNAAEAWLKAVDDGNPMPGERLDTYLGLYKKIKSDRMLMYVQSSKFVPSGTQGRSITKLNGLRNNFVHFLPQGYALQIAMLPQIFTDCLDAIEFLGWSSGNVVWLPPEQRRAKKALQAARKAVQSLTRSS
jgi:hypothetical protein